MRKPILAALCYLLCAFFCACPPQPSPPERGPLVLVFCDVTKSLSEERSVDVIRKAQEVYQYFPVNTEFFFYLVPMGGQNVLVDKYLPSLDVWKNNGGRNRARLKQVIERRDHQAIVKRELLRLQSETTSSMPSCIISSLELVKKLADHESKAPSQRRVEVIYISDMIEQCDCTMPKSWLPSDYRSNGLRIDLHKNDISLENKLAAQLKSSEKPGSLDIYVSIISPPLRSVKESAKANFPGSNELEKFWKTVFRNYGVDVDNSERWGSGDDFPDWIRKQKI